MTIAARMAVLGAFIAYCSFSVFGGHGSAYLGELILHRLLPGALRAPQTIGWIAAIACLTQLVQPFDQRWTAVAIASLLLMSVSLMWFYLCTDGSLRSLILATPFAVFAIVSLILISSNKRRSAAS